MRRRACSNHPIRRLPARQTARALQHSPPGVHLLVTVRCPQPLARKPIGCVAHVRMVWRHSVLGLMSAVACRCRRHKGHGEAKTVARGGDREEGRVGEAQARSGRHGLRSQPRRERAADDAAHATGVLHTCLRGHVKTRQKVLILLVCHSAADLALSRRQALHLHVSVPFNMIHTVDVLARVPALCRLDSSLAQSTCTNACLK